MDTESGLTDPSLRTAWSMIPQDFGAGLGSGELRLQRCAACGRFRYPPVPRCQHCLSKETTWELVSGRGAVWSWTVMHKAYFADYAEDVPRVEAVVQLDEGPFVNARVVDAGNTELRCGLPVHLVPHRIGTVDWFAFTPTRD